MESEIARMCKVPYKGALQGCLAAVFVTQHIRQVHPHQEVRNGHKCFTICISRGGSVVVCHTSCRWPQGHAYGHPHFRHAPCIDITAQLATSACPAFSEHKRRSPVVACQKPQDPGISQSCSNKQMPSNARERKTTPSCGRRFEQVTVAEATTEEHERQRSVCKPKWHICTRASASSKLLWPRALLAVDSFPLSQKMPSSCWT